MQVHHIQPITVLAAVLLAVCASAGFAASSATPASSTALTPPAYLSVKGFKHCLATESQGSYQTWCMPAYKPKSCQPAAWKQLRALPQKDKVPACLAKAP